MELYVENYEDVLEYLPDNSKQVVKNNPYDITKNIIKEIHTYCKNKNASLSSWLAFLGYTFSLLLDGI